MRKFIALLMISLLSISGFAHSGHGNVESFESNSDELEQESNSYASIDVLSGLGLRGLVSAIIAALTVTGLSFRYYFQKSKYSSLKEFIKEGVL